MKNKKDLIKDILIYLKENNEARERFNENFDDKSELSLNSDGELYYYIYKTDSLFRNKRYEGDFCNNAIKFQFLLYALSSPNGKPIYGFLEKEENEIVEIINGIGGLNYPVFKKTGKKIKINHASTLFNILTSQLEQGKSFDDSYKLINDKYNKICIK